MRAIITVVGRDRVGIMASVCTLLAGCGVNILDISQTILQENFTMVMLVDLASATPSFLELQDMLSSLGNEQCLVIRMQREDIFSAMHRI